MTWTPPVTRQDGDMVTHDIWNDQLVENMKFLYQSSNLESTGYSLTESAVGPVETADIFTILGGTMGTHGMVCAEWLYLITADAARYGVVQIRINSSSLFWGEFSAAGAGELLAYAKIWVTCTGAATTQLCIGDYSIVDAITASTEKAWDSDGGHHFQTGYLGNADTRQNCTLNTRIFFSAKNAGFYAQCVGAAMWGPYYADS